MILQIILKISLEGMALVDCFIKGHLKKCKCKENELEQFELKM